MRRLEIDSLKGILISLIVLGHNYFFSKYAEPWFNGLYNFHVASFLLLPFLFSNANFTGRTIKDRVCRILAPHFSFLFLALAAYFIVFVDKDLLALLDWSKDVVLALLIENEELFDQAVGFRHFWFLPAMTLLWLLIVVYDNIDRGRRRLFVIAAITWHLSIGWLESPWLLYLPWGSALIGYLVLPGLIVRAIDRRVSWNRYLDLLLVCVWGLVFWLYVDQGWYIGLAGDPYMFSAARLDRLLMHDAFLLLSFFALLRLGWWLGHTLFPALGRMSLQIFLIHPFLWQVYWWGGARHLSAETTAEQVLLVVASFGVTLGGAYLIARYVVSTPFQDILFPRDPRAWKLGWSKIFSIGGK